MSLGTKFQLRFTIHYLLKDVGLCKETILSTPFSVNSNKKKLMSDVLKPTLFSMNPNFGDCSEKTEVWIKGAWFHRYCGAVVDDHQATVTEVKENLLTVVLPSRPELSSSKTVKVKVGKALQYTAAW